MALLTIPIIAAFALGFALLAILVVAGVVQTFYRAWRARKR